MYLAPSFHVGNLEDDSVKTKYKLWLKNLNGGVVWDYLLADKGHGYEEAYVDGDGYVGEGNPPETCYGEWERLCIEKTKWKRVMQHFVWYFSAHPVTWLSVCDVCSRLGAETANGVNRTERVGPCGRGNAMERAVYELFGFSFGHICHKCLSRSDVQATIARFEGDIYVEELGYIARMKKESRDKLCRERQIPPEHRVLIEKMAELGAVRKASNEFGKFIRDTTKADKKEKQKWH